jgi:hypothetical protein
MRLNLDKVGGRDVHLEQPTAINQLRKNAGPQPANEDSDESDQANDFMGDSVMPPTYDAQGTNNVGGRFSKLPDQAFRGAQMSSTSEAGTEKAS